MIGKLYIDGVDAYTTFGVAIAEGGLVDLISLPQFKPLSFNDWAEEDGEETDLSNPVLPSRNITLPLIAKNIVQFNSLLTALTTGVYHIFNIVSIGKSYKLRLTQMPSFLSIEDMGIVTLRFADDFPPIVSSEEGEDINIDTAVPIFNQMPFRENEVREQGYSIDGLDLSRFGVYLLEGSGDSIRKAPDIKVALSRSSNYISGTDYDEGSLVYHKAKDVILNLFMPSASLNGFWRQWEALHTILLAKGERTLLYANMGISNKGYYKGSRVTYFSNDDRNGVWCEFQTTLRYTDI